MGLTDILVDSLVQEMANSEDQRLLEIAINNPVTLMHVRNGKYLTYQDFESYSYIPKHIIDTTIKLYNHYVKLGVSQYAVVDINTNDPNTYNGLSINVQLFRSKEDSFTNTITVENVNNRIDTYTLNVDNVIFKSYIRDYDIERKIILYGCYNDKDIIDKTYEVEVLVFHDETIKNTFLTEDKHLKASIYTKLKELKCSKL